jgi:hypothetical protein
MWDSETPDLGDALAEHAATAQGLPVGILDLLEHLDSLGQLQPVLVVSLHLTQHLLDAGQGVGVALADAHLA